MPVTYTDWSQAQDFSDPLTRWDGTNPPPPPPPPDDGGSTGTNAPVGQWAASLNGLDIGVDPFILTKAPAIFGWDTMRTSDEPRPAGDGSISLNPDYHSPNLLDFEFFVNVYDELDALARQEQLATAWHKTRRDVWLGVSTPRRQYAVRGRPRRLSVDDQFVEHGIVLCVARFEATDPAFYGLERTVVGHLGASVGGLTFPHTFPHTFGTANVGGVNLTNEGNTDSERLLITLSTEGSALVNPRLELVATGQALQFDLTLDPGHTLVIDMAAASVKLDGTASRSGSLRHPGSTWWALPPGTNTVRFGGTGTGRMTVQYRPAWIL